MKKFLSLALLSLTTVATLEAPAQATQDATRHSEAAMTRIYQRSGLDRAHWELMVAITKQGVTISDHGETCGEFDGFYRFDGHLVICSHVTGKADTEHMIRHEAAHMIQDMKDGRIGDMKLSPFYNTRTSEFWGYYKGNPQVNHPYVETYAKGGSRENAEVYHLEADAEVQQTEGAQALTRRIYSF